ncbi:MAG: ABC transporter permease [Acidimicrobiales bacterium]
MLAVLAQTGAGALENFLTFTVFGVVLASVYFIAASGLVVTYTPTGIFNLAHGAVGMLGAFAYWQLHVRWELPALLSALIVLGVLAPLFGFVLERVMRGLEGVSTVTKVVVSIGLLFALIKLAPIIWDPKGSYSVPAFFGTDKVDILGAGVTYHQLITIGVAAVVALALRWILFGTRAGVSMRAVVDNRSLAQLTGTRPARVSMMSWSLGSMLAALSGILIAERLGLEATALTFLVVNAYAAAVVGRLSSLTLTALGAVILGLAQAYTQGYLQENPSWMPENWSLLAIRGVIPVLMLFAALLLMPNAPLRTQGIQRSREIVGRPTWRLAAIGSVVLVAITAVVALVVSDADVLTIGMGLCFAIVMLSLVPLTGYGGQISLAQMTFAGFGAYAVATWFDGSVLGIVAAILLAGAVGAIVALPALRLSGIYLALATLAFAFFTEKFIFNQRALFPTTAKPVRRLELPFVDLSSDRTYLVFLAVMFVLAGLLVVWLRLSPFGRRLQAMKDSPAACATLGMNLTRTKLQVFALSAGIAGFGGALMAGLQRAADTNQFTALQNLPILLMAVVGGLTMVSGALAGGLFLASFTLVPRWIPDFDVLGTTSTALVEDLFALLPGLLGITLGRNPNGAVAQIGAALRERKERAALDPAERTSRLPVDPVADLESAGVDRPFTDEDVELLDRVLAIDEAEVAAGVTA